MALLDSRPQTVSLPQRTQGEIYARERGRGACLSKPLTRFPPREYSRLMPQRNCFWIRTRGWPRSCTSRAIPLTRASAAITIPRREYRPTVPGCPSMPFAKFGSRIGSNSADGFVTRKDGVESFDGPTTKRRRKICYGYRTKNLCIVLWSRYAPLLVFLELMSQQTKPSWNAWRTDASLVPSRRLRKLVLMGARLAIYLICERGR
mmetsp:Transcript_27420/g.57923  ORF Transcript_27420/g.57923 Transcript_27420/m.57923 type:complete len:205 (+) Transcript_27420:476-1090(+)